MAGRHANIKWLRIEIDIGASTYGYAPCRGLLGIIFAAIEQRLMAL